MSKLILFEDQTYSLELTNEERVALIKYLGCTSRDQRMAQGLTLEQCQLLNDMYVTLL